MPLIWTKEVDMKHPVFQSYRLIRAGRSKGAIIFMVYETGNDRGKKKKFMMRSFLDGFKNNYWAATEQEIRDMAREMWMKWLDFAGLMPVEES